MHTKRCNVSAHWIIGACSADDGLEHWLERAVMTATLVRQSRPYVRPGWPTDSPVAEEESYLRLFPVWVHTSGLGSDRRRRWLDVGSSGRERSRVGMTVASVVLSLVLSARHADQDGAEGHVDGQRLLAEVLVTETAGGLRNIARLIFLIANWSPA